MPAMGCVNFFVTLKSHAAAPSPPLLDNVSPTENFFEKSYANALRYQNKLLYLHNKQTTRIMNREQITHTIRELAQSTGLYGRLLRDLNQNPDYAEEFFAEAEAQNFKDPLDFVLWYEG